MSAVWSFSEKFLLIKREKQVVFRVIKNTLQSLINKANTFNVRFTHCTWANYVELMM